MSYEQTDQDGLYIEDSYFTPDGYYVYVAEAQAAMAVQGSLSANVGVIKDMAVAMTVTTTVVASLANIQGAEMFAFSDAALAADVQRIRDYNVAASSQFSIAIDAVRGIYVSAQADSIASLSANFLRARTGEAATSAAFSVSSTAENIKGFNATLTSSASLTTSVENIKQFVTSLSSASSLTAIISHIEGADLQAFTNASLTTDSQVTKTFNVALISTASLSVSTEVIKLATSSIASTSTLTFIGAYQTRNTLVEQFSGGVYSNIYPSPTQSKFGGYSLYVESKTTTAYYPKNFTWNGTNFRSFDIGYTWTSTDGYTWSRASNDLSVAPTNRIIWDGTRYLFTSNGIIYSSTNGTTWTSIDKSTQNNQAFIEYFGGNYYITKVSPSGSFYDFFIYRSSTWNGTYSQVYTASYTTGYAYIVDTFNTGSRLGFIFNIGGSTTTRIVHSTTGNSGSWTNVSKNDISQIEYGNSVYVIRKSAGALEKSTDLSSWSSVTFSPVVTDIDYKGTNWFVRSDYSVYAGTSIDSLTYSFEALHHYQSYSSKLEYGNSIYVTYGKYSSDALTWTTFDFGNEVNLPGYIAYSRGDNSDYNDFKTLDFWYYHTLNRSDGSIKKGLSTLMFIQGNNRITLSGFGITTPTDSLTSGWNHVRISYNSSTTSLAVYTNGTRQSYTTSATNSISNSYPILIQAGGATDWYIDELLISDELLTDPTITSFTVPTSEYTTNSNVDLLLHFNNNLDDSSSVTNLTRQGNATLTSAFTQSTLGGKVVGGSANISSAFTQSTVITKLVIASATLESNGFVVAAVGRIRPFVDIQSSQFALTANAGYIVSQSSTLQTTATVSAVVTKNFGAITANLTSTATISAEVSLTSGTQANITALGSLLAATGRIRPQVADLSSAFNLSVDSQVVKVSAADLSSQFTQSTVITKNFGPITANLNSQATVSAQVTTIPSGSVVMSSQFTTSVVNQRLRNNLIQSQVTASLSVDAITVIVAVSSQQAEFNQSTQALRIKQLSSAFNSIATELVAAARVGSALVDIQTVSTLTANAITLPSGSVQMQAVSNLNINYTRIKSFNAQLTSAFQPVINVTTSNDATATINVVSSISIGSSKIARTSAGIVANASMSVNARKITNGISLEFTLGTLAASAKRIRNVQCQASVTATLSINAGKQITASANLSVQGFVLAVGDLLYIDPDLIYIVPRETRSFKIRKENRLLVIDQEDREYIVKGK